MNERDRRLGLAGAVAVVGLGSFGAMVYPFGLPPAEAAVLALALVAVMVFEFVLGETSF